MFKGRCITATTIRALMNANRHFGCRRLHRWRHDLYNTHKHVILTRNIARNWKYACTFWRVFRSAITLAGCFISKVIAMFHVSTKWARITIDFLLRYVTDCSTCTSIFCLKTSSIEVNDRKKMGAQKFQWLRSTIALDFLWPSSSWDWNYNSDGAGTMIAR